MSNRNQLSKDSKKLAYPLKKKGINHKDDVIVDPRGQWAHPGKITKIPSGDITMKGVPYPVFGRDNLGNGQMMYPNIDYTFPGQSVTEYPMAQRGGEPRHQMPDGTWMEGEEHGEYEEMELTDDEIAEYRRGGYVVEEYQDGGDVKSEHGWDYKKEGENYLTRRTGNQDWITATKQETIDAIKSKVFKEEVPAQQPNIISPDTSTQTEIFTPDSSTVQQEVIPVQPKSNYVTTENLKDAYLPIMRDFQNTESCTGTGCSSAVSIKLSNLLDGITDENLWADDAWFNKDKVLKNDGALIYETQERDLNKMQAVPKDLWSKLQVGDYVQLNRENTKSSYKFAKQKKEGLENEGIEHLGFIVGKDEDGTPLIWHGSEKGKAYIQRIDGPINLPDHADLGEYKIASIVRAKGMIDKKQEDLEILQSKPYYTPIDKSKTLIAKDNATDSQKQAFKTVNNNIANFKNLGYSQDDIITAGALLIGGIMDNETKGDESLKAPWKQAAAYAVKDIAGLGKKFEGDQASRGAYQIKDDYNFKNKDGSLNKLGEKLKLVGVDPDDVFADVSSQTKAGMIILLDNYKKLKSDKDFDSKTSMYKGKIPASYILAKTWSAGSQWYKKEKYQKDLNNFDISYSNNAINAVNKNVISNSELIERDTNLLNEINKNKAVDYINNIIFNPHVEDASSLFVNNNNHNNLTLHNSTIDNEPLIYKDEAYPGYFNYTSPGMYASAPTELPEIEVPVEGYQNGGEYVIKKMSNKQIAYYKGLGYRIEEI